MSWNSWASCSKSCMQTRVRKCDGPKHGGDACDGSETESQKCKGGECSVIPACTCDYKLERFTCLKWGKDEIERNFEGKFQLNLSHSPCVHQGISEHDLYNDYTVCVCRKVLCR